MKTSRFNKSIMTVYATLRLVKDHYELSFPADWFTRKTISFQIKDIEGNVLGMMTVDRPAASLTSGEVK